MSVHSPVVPSAGPGYLTGPAGPGSAAMPQGGFVNAVVLTPQILANAYTNINALLDGGASVAAVTVDGAGAASVTPVAGTVKVSGTGATGTTLPTPAFTPGTIYKALVPFAMGFIDANAGGTPVFNWGLNCASVTRIGTGHYQIGLNTAVANASRTVCMLTCSGVGSGADASGTAFMNGVSTFETQTTLAGVVNNSTSFFFLLFAE